MLDEFRFYLNTDDEPIWFAPGEGPPDRERHTIQSSRFMLPIAWGIPGFHVAKLPKGITLNTCDYIAETLSEIAPSRQGQRGTSNRKLIGHTDEARPIRR
jgi:hypothetical protein